MRGTQGWNIQWLYVDLGDVGKKCPFKISGLPKKQELIGAKSCAFCMPWCFCFEWLLYLRRVAHFFQGCATWISEVAPAIHGKKIFQHVARRNSWAADCFFFCSTGGREGVTSAVTGRLRMVIASSFLASHFTAMGWFGTQSWLWWDLSRVGLDQVAPRNKVDCHGTSFVRRFSYWKMAGEGEYPYVNVAVLFHWHFEM